MVIKMRLNTVCPVLFLAFVLSGCKLDLGQYPSSWVHQAHHSQRQLDQNQPLARATFIATHNSYNAAAYTTPQRYLDPNQSFSLTQQLDMDVRALELDVHSFYQFDMARAVFRPEFLLCHGTDQHVGCSPFDRTLWEGMYEIRDWLERPENENEVLLLYIEDHSSERDNFNLAVALLDTIGAHTYLPTMLMPDRGCKAIPADLTKADILAAGKNVILISDGCSGESTNFVTFGGFAGGDDQTGYPTVALDVLQPAPACIDSRYDRTELNSTFVRMQEDRTLLTRVAGKAGPKITPETVTNLMDCEINLIGMDKLDPADGRLEAAIWSWAEDQPQATEVDQCALHNSSGRFESARCDEFRPFACRDDASGQWSITNNVGPWDEGVAACAALGLQFSVPFSRYENNRLSELRELEQAEQVWLGYGKAGAGQWQVLAD